MDNQAAVLCTLASIALLYVIRSSWNLGRRLPNMPPGPPTKLIVGNMLDMGNRRLHLKFHQWGEFTFHFRQIPYRSRNSQAIWRCPFRQSVEPNDDCHQLSNSFKRSPR